MKRHLKSVALYNIWAHEQVEEWCRAHLASSSTSPSFAAYDADVRLPLRSFYNTLCHMWAAEQLWLYRIRGASYVPSITFLSSADTSCGVTGFANTGIRSTGTATIDGVTLATFWIDNHQNDGQFERIFRNAIGSSSRQQEGEEAQTIDLSGGNSSIPLTSDHIDNLFAALKDSGREVLKVIEGAPTDAALEATITYKTTDGQDKKMVLAHILTHVLNHATHHRGQLSGAATMLVPSAKHMALDMPIFYLKN